MTAPKFPGFKNNTADFQGKRDQRASPLSYFDVDLSIARSPALGNLLNLNVGGNLFYVDQNPIIGGYGTVYFGDGSVRGGTPVYVGSGFLSNADFVQLSFENVAQPGKILRVIYGTDVNFKPQFGSIAQVNVANTNALPVILPYTIDNPLIVRNVDLNSNFFSQTFVLTSGIPFQIAGEGKHFILDASWTGANGFAANAQVDVAFQTFDGGVTYSRNFYKANSLGEINQVYRKEKFYAFSGLRIVAFVAPTPAGIMTAHGCYGIL